MAGEVYGPNRPGMSPQEYEELRDLVAQQSIANQQMTHITPFNASGPRGTAIDTGVRNAANMILPMNNIAAFTDAALGYNSKEGPSPDGETFRDRYHSNRAWQDALDERLNTENPRAALAGAGAGLALGVALPFGAAAKASTTLGAFTNSAKVGGVWGGAYGALDADLTDPEAVATGAAVNAGLGAGLGGVIGVAPRAIAAIPRPAVLGGAGVLGAGVATFPGDAEAVSAKPFYSALRAAVEQMPRKSGTGEEWMSSIFTPASQGKRTLRDPVTNKQIKDQFEYYDIPARSALPGVKPEEIDYSKLPQFLQDKQKVTRDELVQYLQQHEQNFMPNEEIRHGGTKTWTQGDIDTLERRARADGDWAPYESAVSEYEAQQLGRGGGGPDGPGIDTQWQSMVLPGGTNYKEISLQLPVQMSPEMRAVKERNLAIDRRINDIEEGLRAEGIDPEDSWATEAALRGRPELDAEVKSLLAEKKQLEDAGLQRFGWMPDDQKRYVELSAKGNRTDVERAEYSALHNRMSAARDAAKRDKPDIYRDRHGFPDNTLAHMRVDDRVTPRYSSEQIADIEKRALARMDQFERDLVVKGGYAPELPEGWTVQPGKGEFRLYDPQGEWIGSRTLQSYDDENTLREKAVELYNSTLFGKKPPKKYSSRDLPDMGWKIKEAVKSGALTSEEAAYLAHARAITGIDTTPAKMRTLNINEMQGGWHQDGRAQGYKTPDDAKRLDQLRAEYDEIDRTLAGFTGQRGDIIAAQRSDARMGEIADEIDTLNDAQRYGVPDAPLKNNWHEMAFRRMVKHAADNGYERITWPGTPEQVARIEQWDSFYEKDGKYFNGTGGDDDTNVTSIVNRYLQDLPRYASQLAKKFDAKVEKTTMRVPASQESRRRASDYDDFADVRMENFHGGEPQTFNALTLSPRLIEEAKKRGMPFFNVAGGTAAGAAVTRDRKDEETSKVKKKRGGHVDHKLRAEISDLAQNR